VEEVKGQTKKPSDIEFGQKYNWPRGGVSTSQERREIFCELGLRGDWGDTLIKFSFI
jgi:hypothetical protein